MTNRSRDYSLRTIFDQDPELYDEVRPGYPDELIQDIMLLSRMPKDGKILEIGCGTGQATMPFAKRGFSILCLEIGKNLASFAAKKFREYPNVEVKVRSFEDWEPQKEHFDLVISASAFHWIKPEIVYPKAVKVLKKNGNLAIFMHHRPTPYDDFFIDMQKIQRRLLPEWEDYAKLTTPEEKILQTEACMNETGLFEKVIVKRYHWKDEYTSEQQIKLLNTYSDYRKLDEERRKRLFKEIVELIERKYRGKLTRPYLTVLYFAKKRKKK